MEDVRRNLSAALVEELHERAREFADAGSKIILAAWDRGFSVEQKPDGSLVTDADRGVEQRLRDLIAATYPEHGVLGEEYPPTLPHAEFQWILDPIDGTEDFVHHVPTFGSILSVHYRGAPIVGVLDHPALGLRCHAAFGRGTYRNSERVTLADLPRGFAANQARLVTSARGNYIRYRDEGRSFDAVTRAYPNHRIYRSCYGHTLVATGAVDAMVDYHDSTWDLAACQITTEEAGGAFRVIREFTVDGVTMRSVVFGKPALVAALCDLLDAV
jgi:fructose-1,6-bisphosphatase/inositol monophosphatase family enzyme